MYPAILYNCHEFVSDTEGAGKFRGAVALRREWIYQGVKDGILQLRVDRRTSGPYGILGGESGTPLIATINPNKEEMVDIGKTTITIHPGDILRIQVAGAGGWGLACDRDPSAVRKDIINQFVTAKRAKEVYGVVLGQDGNSVDDTKTAVLREKLKNKSQ